MNENTIRILTFNTWHGLDYRNPYLMLPTQSPRAIFQRMRKQNQALVSLFERKTTSRTLDVYCLQEVNPVGFRVRQLQRLLKARGRGKVANAGIRAGLLGIPPLLSEGIGTFYRGRFQEAKWSSLELSGSGHEFRGPFGIPVFWQLAERRVSLKLRGRYAGLRIAFIQAHLHAGPGSGPASARRSAEIRRLAEWIRPELMRCDLVFLAGDFNNDPDSDETRPLRELGLVSPSHEVTWSPSENPLCQFPAGGTRSEADVQWDERPHIFDRIYFWRRPRAIRASSWDFRVHRVLDEEGLSDHYGLAASVRFVPAK